MTPDEAFKLAFSRYGEAVRDGAFGYDMRGLLSSGRSDAGRAHFGIVDSPHLNAVATRVAGIELTAFFAGAPICLLNAFNAFLSDPDVLPLIGDPSKGSPALGAVEVFDHYAILARGGIGPPKCPHRSTLARNLASSAQCFLLFHERAHIELGHLELLSTRFGAHALEECAFGPMDDAVLAVRRALELDADNAAAFTSLRMWRDTWIADEAVGPRDSDRDALWLLSLYFVFSLFDLVTPSARNRRRATHPSPRTRAFAVLLAVEGLRWLPDLNVPPVVWMGPKNFLKQASTWLRSAAGREKG